MSKIYDNNIPKDLFANNTLLNIDSTLKNAQLFAKEHTYITSKIVDGEIKTLLCESSNETFLDKIINIIETCEMIFKDGNILINKEELINNIKNNL